MGVNLFLDPLSEYFHLLQLYEFQPKSKTVDILLIFNFIDFDVSSLSDPLQTIRQVQAHLQIYRTSSTVSSRGVLPATPPPTGGSSPRERPPVTPQGLVPEPAGCFQAPRLTSQGSLTLGRSEETLANVGPKEGNPPHAGGRRLASPSSAEPCHSALRRPHGGEGKGGRAAAGRAPPWSGLMDLCTRSTRTKWVGLTSEECFSVGGVRRSFSVPTGTS